LLRFKWSQLCSNGDCLSHESAKCVHVQRELIKQSDSMYKEI